MILRLIHHIFTIKHIILYYIYTYTYIYGTYKSYDTRLLSVEYKAWEDLIRLKPIEKADTETEDVIGESIRIRETSELKPFVPSPSFGMGIQWNGGIHAVHVVYDKELSKKAAALLPAVKDTHTSSSSSSRSKGNMVTGQEVGAYWVVYSEDRSVLKSDATPDWQNRPFIYYLHGGKQKQLLHCTAQHNVIACSTLLCSLISSRPPRKYVYPRG